MFDDGHALLNWNAQKSVRKAYEFWKADQRKIENDTFRFILGKYFQSAGSYFYVFSTSHIQELDPWI